MSEIIPNTVDDDVIIDGKTVGEINSANQSKIHISTLGNVVIKGAPVLFAASIAGGCALVAMSDVENKGFLPPCGFYTMTGFYCPGCGMTRSLSSVLGGDFLRAFKYNAVFVLAVPVLIYLYVWWATWAFSGKELPKISINKPIGILLIILGLLFIIGRNFTGPIPEFFALGRL